MNRRPLPSSFAAILQDFFCRYLIDQRNLSMETVASYRDTFRLLLNFIHDRRDIEPADLTLPDLNASLVLEFLRYLEQERGNLVRTSVMSHMYCWIKPLEFDAGISGCELPVN